MSELTRPAIEERLEAIKQRDLYALLGVARTAQAGDIKAAYFALVKTYHPDRVRDPELAPLAAKVFRELSGAQATLADPTKRAAYDRSMRPMAGNGTVSRPNADEELERLFGHPPEAFGDKRIDMARVFHVRGAAHFSRGDLAGAERYMRKALELDGSVSEYYLKLGFTILSNKQLPDDVRMGQSRSLLERAVLLSPYSPDARYSMACFWRAVGNSDQYRRELEAAMRCPGGHTKAEFELNALLRAEARASAGRPAVARPGSGLTSVRGGSDVMSARGASGLSSMRGGSDLASAGDDEPEPPPKKGFSLSRLFGKR